MGTDRYWEAWLAEDLFTFDFAHLLFLNDVGRRIFSFLIWFTSIQHSCCTCPIDHSWWNSGRVTLSALLLVVRRHCLSNQINGSLSLFTSLARIIFFLCTKQSRFWLLKRHMMIAAGKMFQCQVSDLNIKSLSSVLQKWKLVISGKTDDQEASNHTKQFENQWVPHP